MEYFDFYIYSGGYFRDISLKEYVNGKLTVKEGVDSDFVSFFELVDYLEGQGYMKGDSIYYLIPNKSLRDGLVELKSDIEVMDMLECHRRLHSNIINIYTESSEGGVTQLGTDNEEGTQQSQVDMLVGSSQAVTPQDDNTLNDGAVNIDDDTSVSNDDDDDDESESSDDVESVSKNDDFQAELEESTSDDDWEYEKETDEAVKFSDESDNNDDLFDESVKKHGAHHETHKRESTQVPPRVAEEDYVVTDSTNSDELNSPPPSSNEDGSRKRRFEEFMPERDMMRPTFKVGMLFASHTVFRNALREFAVLEGRDIKFKKNEPERVTAVCRKDCGWRIHGSKVNGEESFQIKTFQSIHKCGRSYTNRQATSNYFASKYVENFRDDSGWKVRAFINDVRRQYKVDISMSKAYRARRSALTKVQGDFGKQYGQLWNYCETLKEFNRGSYVKLKVETPRPGLAPMFERLFVILAAQKEGFVSSCRPFIGLDGCFLKSPYGGQLLSAIGRDGNDNFYPISMAIVEVETKDSWAWFLENLMAGLGPFEEHGWTFISDRQKGLMEAFQSVIPGAEHRFCVRHLYANFRDMGFKGKALKDELWGAATAFTKHEFDLKMDAIKKMSQSAYEYVSNINPASWSRHAFSPRSKCDLLVNNLTESFNSYILDAREKPICTMMEQIRTMLMCRYHKKREGINKMNQNIPSKIQKKLEKSKMDASSCKAMCSGSGLFQVSTQDKSFVVNLGARTCGCRRWDLSGIPCSHAVAAIYEDLRHPEDYVSEFYTKELYMKAYQPLIYPVPSQEQWVQTSLPKLQPPKPRKAIGRPKKCRKRGQDESKTGPGIRLRQDSLRCSNCRKFGHNVRTCKEPLTTNRTMRKRKRSQAGQTEEVRDSSDNQGPRFVQNSFGIGVSYEPIKKLQPRRKVENQSTQPATSQSAQATTHSPKPTQSFQLSHSGQPVQLPVKPVQLAHPSQSAPAEKHVGKFPRRVKLAGRKYPVLPSQPLSAPDVHPAMKTPIPKQPYRPEPNPTPTTSQVLRRSPRNKDKASNAPTKNVSVPMKRGRSITGQKQTR